MFWMVVVLLVALALAFCWPLWRGNGQTVGHGRAGVAGQVDRTAYNAALYKDFAAELAEDLTLDEVSRAALLADKARQLLDDSPDEQGSRPSPAADSVAAAPVSAGPLTKFVVVALLVAGSGLTYWQLGTPGADDLVAAREILRLPSLGEQEAEPDAGTEAEIARLRTLTGGLRAHVQRSPEQAGSWYLLGIGELKLGAYAASADAFAAAHKLVGADANLDLYWLQARLLADGGKLSAATQEIAKRVLATQPNQPMVLNMLALAAFRTEDFATAVGYLNSALSNNLTEGQRELLSSGFAQARASLGVSGPTVDVALEIAGQPPADAVLFVIARPVGGGMPYAVVRRPVGGVPEAVRLDDAVSMNPANPLSAAADVEIIARLSLSGRPQEGPGDWQWRSKPLRLQAAEQPIRLSALLSAPRSEGQ